MKLRLSFRFLTHNLKTKKDRDGWQVSKRSDLSECTQSELSVIVVDKAGGAARRFVLVHSLQDGESLRVQRRKQTWVGHPLPTSEEPTEPNAEMYDVHLPVPVAHSSTVTVTF